MNKNQILLTSLLSAALSNQSIKNLDLHGADWNAIYEEAKAHEVHTLIYPLIKDINSSNFLDETLKAKWKRQAVAAGTLMIKHMEQIHIIFNEFNNSNIRFIPLKGLVIRDLYPIPEMRTMGDGDILVDQKDIKKACEILLNMGYINDSTDSKHMHFIHATHMCIEIHYLLITKGLINKNLDNFEINVWKDTKQSLICNVPVIVLSSENQIFHLILHMAVHLSSLGFGLRQLCDFFLMIEKNRDEINWDNLYGKINEYGITSFSHALLLICKNFFNYTLPEVFINHPIDEDCINILIDDIFCGGLFGNRTWEREINSMHLQYIDSVESSSVIGKWKIVQKILFPSVSKLGTKYSYAKKFPILTPVAWMHRLFYGAISRDFTLSQKKSLLIPNKSDSLKIMNRAKLLHQLDLK